MRSGTIWGVKRQQVEATTNELVGSGGDTKGIVVGAVVVKVRGGLTTSSLAEPWGTGEPNSLLLAANEPRAWLCSLLAKPPGGVLTLSLNYIANSSTTCLHPPTCPPTCLDDANLGNMVGYFSMHFFIFARYTYVN